MGLRERIKRLRRAVDQLPERPAGSRENGTCCDSYPPGDAPDHLAILGRLFGLDPATHAAELLERYNPQPGGPTLFLQRLTDAQLCEYERGLLAIVDAHRCANAQPSSGGAP